MAKMNLLKQGVLGAVLTAVLFLLAGCETTTNSAGGSRSDVPVPGIVFKVSDLVVVTFSGVEPPPAQHEERIKEDGTITLSLIGSVKAEGKTPGQLQKEIRALYVPRYYGESFNVTVKAQERYFYVGGEVKSASRYVWVEGMTVVKAVQNAGGLTEWAYGKKVRVTRHGKSFTVNYQKALEDPSLDVDVYPDDSIDVARRGPFQ